MIQTIIENDKKIFTKIYMLGENCPIIGKIGKVGTILSYYIFFALFVTGIIFVYLYRREYLFKFIIVPFCALMINTFLRKSLKRVRPCDELPIKSRIGRKKTYSCPSNHSASAMVITISFIWVFPNIGIFLLPLAVFTGFSRILSGVHYPLDVLMGFFTGSFIGAAGFWVLSFI